MRGQIQIISVKNMHIAQENISENKEDLLKTANANARTIKAIDIKTKVLHDKNFSFGDPMLVVEVIIDTKNAMGANAVNSMCELLSSKDRKNNSRKSSPKNIVKLCNRTHRDM